MASPLVWLMYPIVGPFAILKLYAKNLMHHAYGNQILLKLAASLVSLAVGSQIAYKYRYHQTFVWLTSGLLTFLVNYWYVIPLLLIYVQPVISNIIQAWLSLLDWFAEGVLRPCSTKFRQFLPAVWTFESNQKLWPLESIYFMLTYGSIGPALYCGYETYSHLCFGISFNLCLATGVTILVTTTLWHLLEAIDRDLYPFIFAIIVQYYIIPIRSALNIPLTLLLTTFLFPFLNNLLTSNSIQELIQNITLMNFRTFLEANANYKQFFSEFVNLFLAIYLTYRTLIISFHSGVSWLLILSTSTFLPLYFYTKLMRFIAIEPNATMFLFSSFLLSKYILHRHNDDHFIYKYFLVIMVLTFYFALIYPLLYHLLRRATINSATRIALRLKSYRERINQLADQFDEQYLRIAYVHDRSKYFILHLCNVLIALCLLLTVPINLIFRLILSLLSYLLVGRLLLARGIEILAILASLCTSLIAGADVYARYDNSILITMSIALTTYMSTSVIAFPIVYRLLQFLITHLPLVDSLDYCLQGTFAYAWSFFGILWPHITASFDEVKSKIEQSRLNLFRPLRARQ